MSTENVNTPATPPEPSQARCAVPICSALLDKLEAELGAIKYAAVEASADFPPEGYTELNPIHGVVADRCWQHGLDAMETAIANWIYDQRHNSPNDERSAAAEIDRLTDGLVRLRDNTSCTVGQYAIIDSLLPPNHILGDTHENLRQP